MIATHLIKQAGVKRSEAATGAVTLIQRFGSAANFNIHLHGLVLDGVYHTGTEGAPVFRTAPAITNEKLQALLDKIIRRILRLLTRLGHLIEEEGKTHRDVAARIHATARSPGAAPTPASDTLSRGDCAHAHGARVRMTWARLLKRVFDLDLERCERCGGKMKIIEAPSTGSGQALKSER